MASEAQPLTQAKRILVVEDELMIRMLLEVGTRRDIFALVRDSMR
jgi:hypothetical protein